MRIDSKYKIIIIENESKIRYENNNLIVENSEGNKISVCLNEILSIMIDSSRTTLSTYLIQELMNSKICLIFCNKSHFPEAQLIPFNGAFNSSLCIDKQMKWDKETKDKLWINIVKNKIANQNKLILNRELKDNINLLIDEINIDNSLSIEAVCAKKYFHYIFGEKFVRFNDDETNKLLNYGYTILLSLFVRSIVAHGYLSQIGIKHCSYTNAYNLASDLMEPFRALIDKKIIDNGLNILDNESKSKLIDFQSDYVIFDNKNMNVINVIDEYVVNCINYLNNKTNTYKEISFYG